MPSSSERTTPKIETDPSITVISPTDYEAAAPILNNVLFKLWDAVDELTKLRPKKTRFYQVTIFGSARIASGTPEYEALKELSAKLTALGCYIITGGGPGLMRAANEGALLGAPDHPERSVGIRVDLPFEQETNDYVGEVYQHKTFFSRLHHFYLRSNAYIVTPGGIGTTLELMMVWQLLQVRKLYDTPILLVGKMWTDLLNWARLHMVESGRRLADPVDMDILQCVDCQEDAVKIIQKQYERWKQETE
ncbi:MAG: LOG family protein [Deltaproteobacteria bacterium]|nr:LOG family protein [Deltaproteobacteria bacterium]